MRRLLGWLALPSLYYALRFEGCCYGRPLFWARSWELLFIPRPVPQFDAWRSDAELVLVLGWLEVRVRTPLGMKLPMFSRPRRACLSWPMRGGL